ncbi:MAG: AAA family ATPase [Treponema sp.]|nr:AAA family ATPase [Treponema sp.]
MIKTLHFNDQNVMDIEKQLLGSYILGAAINDLITENVFYHTFHKIIFPVIKELKTNNIDIDIIVLVSELKKKGLLEKAGNTSYVSDLTTGIIGTTNTEYYESEILTAYKARTLHRAAVTAKENLENCMEIDLVNKDLLNALETITRTETINSTEQGILFKDLIKKEFPPDNFIIEKLITTGLTVLTGASKIGKSWTAMQAITALDQGTYFLGTLKAEKTDCLYCALEDTEKRIQKRLKKQGVTKFNGSRLEIKRRTVENLRAFLKVNPQYKVIIIDTFQKMMGLTDLNDYAKTVSGMSALKAIADDLNRAIIVIHHNRKSADFDGDHMESALGSTGINATADCTITMRRKRGDKQATMAVSGRDIEDTTFNLSWDKDCCSWTITSQEELKPSLPEAQKLIIDILESEDRNWETSEIVKKTGKTNQAISNTLSKMKENDLILNPYHGQWKAKSKYTNTPSLSESVKVYLPETEPEIKEPVEELDIF